MLPIPNPFQEIVDRLNSIETMLIELKGAALQPEGQASTTAAEPLDVRQAAGLLRLSKQTVYDKVHAGMLPHHKQGNRIYFFRDELLEWVKTGRQPTAEDLQQKARLMATTEVGKHRRKGGRSRH